jgi:hypothetical protein
MWHAWGKIEKCARYWRESLKEKDKLEDRGVDGRIRLKRILVRLAGVWIAFNWLRIGPVAGSCEQGNEYSGSSATELAYRNQRQQFQSLHLLQQLITCSFSCHKITCEQPAVSRRDGFER